jgi:YHS domain-containing protein
MKMIKNLTVAALALAFIASPLTILAADKAAKAKPYPLDTCVVTGEKLGGMGDPVVYVYQGQEVKFCCKGCVTTFKKDPAKYIKKIEEAAKNKK